MNSVLLIGPNEVAKLATLVELAKKNPVDMRDLMKSMENPDGKKKHMDQMTKQSVMIPIGYMVTFSIETNHPVGTCRHMSMSTSNSGQVPNQHAIWMVAEELGFWGALGAFDAIWLEDLEGHGKAVNVVQRLEQPTFN